MWIHQARISCLLVLLHEQRSLVDIRRSTMQLERVSMVHATPRRWLRNRGDSTPATGKAGLRADLLVLGPEGLPDCLLVLGPEGLPDCFVDVAVSCSAAPSFSTQAQVRRGTPAERKFQEKVQKYERLP